ncbi:MAG: hypothetical protein ACOX6D_02580 [Thermoguttaceae bacterium]|jgi:hypothetical protein
MIHPEQTIADAIKSAAGDDPPQITCVTAENVFTTADAVGQWEGENKVYVVPTKTEPVRDMLSADASSGFVKTELTVTCLGATRDAADTLMHEVLPVVEAAFRDAGFEATLTAIEAVNRFEGGSWKDEYYQVRTYIVYHQ